jgi:hypothetical protein
VPGAEALLERHHEHRSEIDARSGAFQAFEDFGNDLINAEHFATDDIKQKLQEMDDIRQQLETYVSLVFHVNECSMVMFRFVVDLFSQVLGKNDRIN